MLDPYWEDFPNTESNEQAEKFLKKLQASIESMAERVGTKIQYRSRVVSDNSGLHDNSGLQVQAFTWSAKIYDKQGIDDLAAATDRMVERIRNHYELDGSPKSLYWRQLPGISTFENFDTQERGLRVDLRLAFCKVEE